MNSDVEASSEWSQWSGERHQILLLISNSWFGTLFDIFIDAIKNANANKMQIKILLGSYV